MADDSTRPAASRAAQPCVRGDAAAQKLDDMVSTSALSLGREGLEGFWDNPRREWVMELPAGSGLAVLAAFLEGLPADALVEAAQRPAAAHARLAGLVVERWRVDFQRLQAAVAPHVSQAAFQPSAVAEADFAGMALRYGRIWKAQLDKELRAAIQDQNVARHPWRATRGASGAAASATPPPRQRSRRTDRRRSSTPPGPSPWPSAAARAGRRCGWPGPAGRSGPTPGTLRI